MLTVFWDIKEKKSIKNKEEVKRKCVSVCVRERDRDRERLADKQTEKGSKKKTRNR